MSDLPSINFTRGVPATESFPIDELIEVATAAFKQHGVAMMQYGSALGFAPLREWLAQWQGVQPNQVLTGNGSLELFDFLCLQLLQPGDLVFTESPTYDRTITLLRRHRATVVGIPLEPDGPNIAALEAELKKHVPKFFYLIPDFQNPSGATCSGTKRLRVVELAKQYNFTLLEDAPYRLLRYRGREEPTLFTLAPQRTLHMSSFTKLLGPGVRLGFMLGEADLLAKLAKVAEDTYISPGYVAHGITYEWCHRGLLPPQIEKLKALYAPRLGACLAAIDQYMPDAQATRPDGGFFLSVTLPAGVLTTAARTGAAKHNLHLADGLAFFPNGGGERFLRLPYCALTPEQIDEGIRRLAETMREVRAN
ncbi:MAG TPA: PLP-dependent aminotransferase family protein [Candidatus Binatia bacterium]|jgi:DNA-binding transcriptional MocR family regulator|nr:PLP-dependent aminotransferase family protein [Candidatus Binatia bacterium]